MIFPVTMVVQLNPIPKWFSSIVVLVFYALMFFYIAYNIFQIRIAKKKAELERFEKRLEELEFENHLRNFFREHYKK